jgi:rhodanese-related sulfurtransferase
VTCTGRWPRSPRSATGSRSGPATSAARCGGGGLSGKTSSTIGFERLHNPLLGVGPDEFVERLTESLPPKPPNGGRIVELNRSDSAQASAPPSSLDREELGSALAGGAQILDGRSPADFDRAHLTGAIWLPPGSAQGTRAGWVVDSGDELVIVADDLDQARQISLAMQAVGLWNIVGLTARGPDDWAAADLPVARGDQWDLAASCRAPRSSASPTAASPASPAAASPSPPRTSKEDSGRCERG